MQGKDLILVGALGGLGYLVYKWWENTQSTAPVSVQQTTNASGQTIASVNVGGAVPSCIPPNCITTPTGVVIPVPPIHSFRGVRMAPVTMGPFRGAYATGKTSTRGTSGLGHITPSIGFGIRRAANIFPTGIERRIIY